MILLEGDKNYQQNWLYFSDILIFSPANKGGHVLYSAQYIRVLVAMVVAGLATAIKRVTIALYFGKTTVRTWSLVETFYSFPPFSHIAIFMHSQASTNLVWIKSPLTYV
jgi:hypothetical protein